MDDLDLYDDNVLERELQQAMKSAETISLFKTVRDNLQVKGELANTKAVQMMLAKMWEDVADFFEEICMIETLAGLRPTDDVVTRHARMRACFDAVAVINNSFKDAKKAMEELEAEDMSEQMQEDHEYDE